MKYKCARCRKWYEVEEEFEGQAIAMAIIEYLELSDYVNNPDPNKKLPDSNAPIFCGDCHVKNLIGE